MNTPESTTVDQGIDTPEFWNLANAWASSTIDTPQRAAAMIAFIKARQLTPAPAPSGYAYRYPDGYIRFTNGESINGSDPAEAVPYFFAVPPPTTVPANATENYATIRYTPTESNYLATVLIDRISHLSMTIDGRETIIHVIGGKALFARESLNTLDARINLARRPA